jgi:hypothetical protein
VCYFLATPAACLFISYLRERKNREVAVPIQNQCPSTSSYTVATENLGKFPGLLAGTALLIDYILTAAVGISAGVGALVSAVPVLLSSHLSTCAAWVKRAVHS